MAFLPLVRRTAWHVHGRVALASGIAIDDLSQAGMVALVEAAQGHDERAGAFAAYAALRIKGAMIDLVRRQAASNRRMLADRRWLAKARAALEQTLHRRPADSEVARAMDLTPAAFRALVDASMGADEESLDAVDSDGSMWFADRAERTDDALARRQLAAQVAELITALPERQAMVLQLYFVGEFTLDEIGAVLGVGAARVCQLKKAALDALRAQLPEE